jgi:hypothetical protein
VVRLTVSMDPSALLKPNKAWEVRSAGKGPKGEQWYAWDGPVLNGSVARVERPRVKHEPWVVSIGADVQPYEFVEFKDR